MVVKDDGLGETRKLTEIIQRRRLEEGAEYLIPQDHWELFTTPFSCTERDGRKYHTSSVHIPVDVARHLQLKKGEKIEVAIRRLEP